MAQKRTNSANTNSPAKTEFVRSFPSSVSAGEVVEKAKSAGIELTAVRVHKIRSADKMKRARARSAKRTSALALPAVAKVPSATPARGSKSAFIRSMPLGMPAKEIVAKAKAEGISFSIGQVYNIRSVTKTKGAPRNAPKDARTLKSTAQLHLIRLKATGTGGDGDEAHLRKLIAEVGLARARDVIAEVAAAFGG